MQRAEEVERVEGQPLRRDHIVMAQRRVDRAVRRERVNDPADQPREPEMIGVRLRQGAAEDVAHQQARAQGQRQKNDAEPGGEDEGQRQQPPAPVLDRPGQVTRRQEHDAAGGEQRHPTGQEGRHHAPSEQQLTTHGAHRSTPRPARPTT